MAGLRFGTDGVRGRAFDELTEAFAASVGRAAARVLTADEAVIGRDTRESGPALRNAVCAGLVAGGVDVVDIGVVPTPAVAYVAAQRRSVGVMISASHNQWHDNGLKLFAPNGSKLSDDEQGAIEKLLNEGSSSVLPAASPHDIVTLPSAAGAWADSVRRSIEGDLAGLSVVVDAAHGSASHLAAPVLADLGADVDVIAASPDGRNINAGCGSTHPEMLASAVVEAGADVGIAFDGDADRLVCVDHLGQVVHGDRLLAVIAGDLAERNRLRNDTVVVTVMTNLGFHRAMQRVGINVHVTPVGDRHILEALGVHGWSFGGEQSGHLIFGDLATTGDGLLSAVQLLDAVVRSGRPLATLAHDSMTPFPQVLHNVPVSTKVEDPGVMFADQIAAAESELGDDGRVLVRASGTEPLIRVMVEAADGAAAERICAELCTHIAGRVGH